MHPVLLGISGVIFDMDGVLCDSEALLALAACTMFEQRFGIKPVSQDFKPFIGAGENRYLGGVATQYGLELNMPADKEETYRIYLELIPGKLKPLPGVLEFFTHIERAGLLRAVATSADPIKMKGNLKEIGLDPGRFQTLVTAEDVEHPKPHPDIFLTAAQRLGLAPGQCVVIEDSLHGVEAGCKAGCRVIAVSGSFDSSRLLEAGAEIAVQGLDSLVTASETM